MKLTMMLLTIVLACYASAGVANACCGHCEGDKDHTHEHGDAHEHSNATEPKQATMDTSYAPAHEEVTLKSTRFVVLKGTLSDPAAMWEKLPGLAGAQGLLGASTHAWSVVPEMPDTSDPEKMDPNLPYWAAFTIDSGAQPVGELEVYTSPGGKYAMTVHRGPYEGLGKTWEKFAGQIVGSGQYDAARPMLENYVSDPGNTPEADLITHLYIPVK